MNDNLKISAAILAAGLVVAVGIYARREGFVESNDLLVFVEDDEIGNHHFIFGEAG